MIRRTYRKHPALCPRCYTATDLSSVARKAVVTCCVCGTKFTKHLWKAPFLPKVGVVCPDHNSIRSAK